MKLVRRIATLFLCMCLVVPCFTMMTHAAAKGTLSFENKEVKAGEEFSVSLKGQVDAGIGGRKVTITYDSALLEFVSGTNTTKVSDGELQYEASEEINSLYNAKEFCQLTFKALGNGTAKVGISTYDIKSSYEIEWTCHDAEVAISGGESVEQEETEAPTEEVEQEETETPTEETEQEETETPSEEEETTENDAQVVISNTTTITILSDVSEIVLPERYNETSVAMDGNEFPAWQDSMNTDMYIVYATSSNGVTSLYQYDTMENTYQRFEAPEQTESTVGTAENILSMFGDKANMILIGVGALLLLFLILIIVLAVKLYNRNAELDEVYDDLDHALEEKEAAKKMEVIETEDDVVMETEETEDNSDAEVEFYVEEAVKEFFEEETAVAEDEDDSEVEVEFYVEEPAEELVEELVEDSVEEPVEETADETELEDDSDVEVEFYVEEPVEESLDKTIRIPEIEETVVKTASDVEYYDDDEEFFDDDFFVNFIDLDD